MGYTGIRVEELIQQELMLQLMVYHIMIQNLKELSG